MNIALISTYELGRQPFGLVSPAAWLRNAGHQVSCVDLTRDSLNPAAICAAQLIAIYLPMHTATRLAAKLIPQLRGLNPGAHVCCYGLYAPMNAEYLRSLGVATILGGEFEAALVRVAERLSAGAESPNHKVESKPSWGTPCCASTTNREPQVSLERLQFQVPDRAGLPPLGKYAHLVMPGQGFRVVKITPRGPLWRN